MAPQCLTVLAPLRPADVERVRGLLRAIGDDIAGKRTAVAVPAVPEGRASLTPHIDFPRSRRIHFARFGILTDPDRGPDRCRLLFASVYDGDLDAHLSELVSITTDMNALWSGCEGYAGIAHFAAFIRAHAQEADAYYVAFRDETVDSITQAIARRRRAHALQDAADSMAAVGERGETAGAARDAVADAIARFLRAAPIVVDLVRAVVRYGPLEVLLATRHLTASLDRYTVFRLFNRLTRNRIPPMRAPFSSVSLERDGPAAAPVASDESPVPPSATPPSFREDAVTQNQLTVVTVVDPARVTRVRAVLAGVDSYAKRLAPSGSLIGISTIHFVRWLLIDEGRRLMLVSDYDGSWEAYIDEFAEMILSGLDAIWDTSFGVPPDGARDLPAFKRYLRTHQVPAEAFFAAYPDETVLNILADRAAAPAAPLTVGGPAAVGGR